MTPRRLSFVNPQPPETRSRTRLRPRSRSSAQHPRPWGFGSYVYGTNVPTSDLDFKAVHIPAAEDILLQRVKPAISVNTKEDRTQKNGAGDTDFESFALQKYLAMLLEGQTVALTMLFVPDRWIIEQSAEWSASRRTAGIVPHRLGDGDHASTGR